MKTYMECVPCFARQAYNAAKLFAPNDPDLQDRLMRRALRQILDSDFTVSPPELAQRMYRMLEHESGVADPYAPEKAKSNELALKMMPALRDRIRNSQNPLEAAVRIAIAGNIIDFGAPSWKDGIDLGEVVGHALEAEICLDSFAALQDRLRTARRILYLGDNCGEIVFDRMLVEQLPAGKVVFAVRGKPVLNDATLPDAEYAGLPEICRVISNGTDAPGTILKECSEEFRETFHSADVVISKGQGNYESLSEEPREIFFMLKVKCPVVAEHTGRPLGSVVLYRKA